MKKLSKKSLEFIELFLKEDFGYISVSKHDMKILYEIYNKVISIINESEERENNLIKYLEDNVKKLKHTIFVNAITSEDIDLILLKTQLNCFEDILEKVKSGKYD